MTDPIKAMAERPPSAQHRRDTARYDLGVIADILHVLASADISGVKTICGTSIEYLADRMDENVEQLEQGGAV